MYLYARNTEKSLKNSIGIGSFFWHAELLILTTFNLLLTSY